MIGDSMSETARSRALGSASRNPGVTGFDLLVNCECLCIGGFAAKMAERSGAGRPVGRNDQLRCGWPVSAAPGGALDTRAGGWFDTENEGNVNSSAQGAKG